MKTIKSLILMMVLLVLLASPQSIVAAADTLVWEIRQDMPTARYYMGAAVSGGKIYVVGGDNYSCNPLASVEEYNPAANTWNIRASMPTARWRLGVVTGPDGRIYAIGGAGGSNCGSDILGTVEIYDPVTDTWTPGTSMPTPRMDLGVVAAANGKIYAMGGDDSNGWFATVEEYDPVTDTWTTKNNMPWPNKNFTAAAASNGRIYVLGGHANTETLLEYNPGTDTWISRTPFPKTRFHPAMSQASNGKIYVVGGDNNGVKNTVDSYDPLSDNWSVEASIFTPRSGHSMVTVGGTIYVLGGWGGSGPISSVEAGTIIHLSNDAFADSKSIIPPLPFDDTVNMTYATLENGEPKSSCGLYGSLWKTVWYEYTPTTNQVITASVPAAPFAPVLAVYTGDSLSNLVELGCKIFRGAELTLSVVGGTTYYFQVGKYTSWDPDGEAQFHIEIPENLPPIAEAGNYKSVPEGSTIMLNAYKSYDPEGFPLIYEWDLDNDGEYDDATGVTTNVSFGDNGYLTVGLRVTDIDGLSGTDVTKLSFFNLNPYIESITAPPDPSQVGTLININGGFADSGFLDTHTATWDWGDGTTSNGVVDGFDVNGTHVYGVPGVYTLTLTVEDDDGGVATADYEYVVIYDPEGSFVTGSGWIWSPEGAYTPDPSLVGKANFGFVSKYQKGASVPNGDTEFEFNVADFHFESTSYDWLVIAGSKAQFKGIGTINGVGEYKFMLSALDGSPDKFRIKIWDTETGLVVYDNMLDADETADPSTEIQGGSIVVHKAK